MVPDISVISKGRKGLVRLLQTHTDDIRKNRAFSQGTKNKRGPLLTPFSAPVFRGMYYVDPNEVKRVRLVTRQKKVYFEYYRSDFPDWYAMTLLKDVMVPCALDCSL
jgi:hypothetical protein